jgi:ATP-dependent 26S proteasome regulatory subunit
MIHFPMPRAGERLKLWQQAIPLKATLDPAVDLRAIAEGFELSGASILNVVRHAALAAVSRDSDILTRTDIDQGIRRELAKEGRSR